MLKLIFGTMKLAIFAALVLVLGNWVRYDGRTISEHVRIALAQAQHLDLGRRATEIRDRLAETRSAPRRMLREADEEIPASERQKLRALIRELNHSSDQN